MGVFIALFLAKLVDLIPAVIGFLFGWVVWSWLVCLLAAVFIGAIAEAIALNMHLSDSFSLLRLVAGMFATFIWIVVGFQVGKYTRWLRAVND